MMCLGMKMKMGEEEGDDQEYDVRRSSTYSNCFLYLPCTALYPVSLSCLTSYTAIMDCAIECTAATTTRDGRHSCCLLEAASIKPETGLEAPSTAIALQRYQWRHDMAGTDGDMETWRPETTRRQCLNAECVSIPSVLGRCFALPLSTFLGFTCKLLDDGRQK